MAQDRFDAVLASRSGNGTDPAIDRDGRLPRPDRDGGLPAPAAVRALAAFNPGRQALKPLLAVAVAVAALAGYLVWHSRPTAQVVAPRASVAALAPTAPTSSAPTMIVIAIQGRVRHPGLVRLPAGARVADAIDAAGGPLPGTDLSYVNLAQKLVDGELIVIAKSGPAGGSGGVAAGPAGLGSARPLNLNTATATQLEALPGIGPSLAGHIIDYRTTHGAFKSVDELRNVPGIGDAKFAEVKDLVTV